MNEKYIIDRVEDSYVIIEKNNEEIHKISIYDIKGQFKEGDVLLSRNGYFEVDKSLTLNRKKQIDKIMEDMWEE